MNAVIDRTGGAGEVKDVIDFAHIKGFANIFFDELKTWFTIQVGEIGAAAGEEVIDDNRGPAFGKKSVAKMGS